MSGRQSHNTSNIKSSLILAAFRIMGRLTYRIALVHTIILSPHSSFDDRRFTRVEQTPSVPRATTVPPFSRSTTVPATILGYKHSACTFFLICFLNFGMYVGLWPIVLAAVWPAGIAGPSPDPSGQRSSRLFSGKVVRDPQEKRKDSEQSAAGRFPSCYVRLFHHEESGNDSHVPALAASRRRRTKSDRSHVVL